MKANHFGKLKKENGKLIYMKATDQAAFNTFRDSIPEGSIIEFYAEEVHDDGSLAQLAKIHPMIRALSSHTGFTFSELKLLVKERAGLCISRSIAGKEYFVCKSFGECDKTELSAAIQAVMEIGEEVNFPLS